MTTLLSLGPAEVFKGAQIRAHRDVSVRLLQETMAKLAAAGALQSGLAARFGARAAQLDEQQVQDAPDRLSEPGTDRPLSGRLRPSQPLSHEDTPTYTNIHEMSDLEKQAFIRALGRAGAAATGRVRDFLKRRIRNPIKTDVIEGAGKVRSLRSPITRASATPPPIPSRGGGPFRGQATQPPPRPRYTSGPGTKVTPKVEEHLKKVRESAVGRDSPSKPGFMRKPIKGLVAAGLIGGGLYATAKGGSKAVDSLQRASSQPMRANFTRYQQHRFGY